MSLTLNVLSFKNKPIPGIQSVVIGKDGGSIGRADDNTLVLPDAEKFVSRHHARISFENSCYYLSDTSLSGVYINGGAVPLNNATERLDNGMQLRIGEYEITVVITNEQVTNDFPFTSEPKASLSEDEPWVELGIMGTNDLMSDHFPSHEELVHTKTDVPSVTFESQMKGNHSPLFDSYKTPNIITPSTTPSTIEKIPENINFDDFFSTTDEEPNYPSQNQIIDRSTVDNDYEDFFGVAIGNMAAELDQARLLIELPIEKNDDISESIDVFVNNALADEHLLDTGSYETAANASTSQTTSETNRKANDIVDIVTSDKAEIEPTASTSLESSLNMPRANPPETDTRHEEIKIKKETDLVTEAINEKKVAIITNSVLFNAFLQGAGAKSKDIQTEQHTEALYRIGQMFRKLIDGTVAVLRSRAEFKSLCRVNMTVIKATKNNPLKFTVSTDDVLRQLIENKSDGFLTSTNAIEEAFNDIMNHQLAMQAGIQASLTDLLKTFDPQLIEKQFEQGIVLQKKSKCWDRYEDTYRNKVDDVVENFFGEAFVKAYEQQINLLMDTRRKRQDE